MKQINNRSGGEKINGIIQIEIVFKLFLANSWNIWMLYNIYNGATEALE